MKLCSLYRVELRRLALSKYTWVAAALSLCGPLLGYAPFFQSGSFTTTTQYIALPVLTGTVIGAVLWAVLALLEGDRAYRAKADVLVDAITSPVRMALVRMAALVTLSGAACVLCALAYLPYTLWKADSLFRFDLYIQSYLILTLPTWWISLLLAAALYQIARRVELAGLLYAVCVYGSFSRFTTRDYFARWLNPLIPYYSDGFSSLPYLRIALYTRALWLALAGGLWVFSLLCIRRYQKNLIGSMGRGLRKAYLPAIAALLLTAGASLWIGQPFVDHGPLELKPIIYDNSGNTMISAVAYRLTVKPWTGRVHATAEYTTFRGDAGRKSIWLNPGYTIRKIECDGQAIDFQTTTEIVYVERRTDFILPETGWKTLAVEYEGYPTVQRRYPIYVDNEISAEYVSLINAGSLPRVMGLWLPTTSTLELTLPGNLIPIANHELLTDSTDNADGTKTWMATISAYNLWLMACDYQTESFDAAGITVDFIYSAKYEKIVREHQIVNAITEVLDYCTEHLGPLSWAGDRNLMMLQRSALMGGGNAGAGWVEWSETVFTANNLSDPLKGANAEEVFVHEMVHQWWGGLGVTCGESWDVSDESPWSDEGLTVYTTYRIMKEKYGEDYAKQHYVDVWQAAVDIQERGFYYRHPEYLETLPEQYRAELAMRARETNLYCRMPLMILKAEQLAGGEEKMDEILRGVQKRYANNGYDNPFTYQNFLDACGLREEELILGQDTEI